MMTNGPEAEVGDVLEVKFPRPRERKAVMEHPDYYELREHLIEFLEVHAHRKKRQTVAEPKSSQSSVPQMRNVSPRRETEVAVH
jgi:hypothetical protein